MTEALIILLLIVLNGVFAMAEAAMIASRRARLQQLAERDNTGAQVALQLVESPNRFLSTVQIGITLIGILAGAFGGATIAHPIALEVRKIDALAPYGEVIGFGVVVLVTTYLSLIIGELVPKRLALRNPERIAALVAQPMRLLSVAAAPVVSLLTVSTDVVLAIWGVRPSDEAGVTEEEIQTMIQQGIETGVFEAAEHEMVRGVFRLGDRHASTIMTPRTEIVWLDVEDPPEETMRKIRESEQMRYPVCEGDFDHVIGVALATDMLTRCLEGQPFDIRVELTEPLYLPESMLASRVLEAFKRTGKEMALVIGEHGGLQGLITLQDLLEEIVGDVEEPRAVRRDDNSWLLDGMLPVDELKETLGIDDQLPGERDQYETLGGFVMAQLGRIPQAADTFDFGQLHFEVVDMDGNRVDKVLATIAPPAEETAETGTDGEAESE